MVFSMSMKNFHPRKWNLNDTYIHVASSSVFVAVNARLHLVLNWKWVSVLLNAGNKQLQSYRFSIVNWNTWQTKKNDNKNKKIVSDWILEMQTCKQTQTQIRLHHVFHLDFIFSLVCSLYGDWISSRKKNYIAIK